MEEVKSWYNGYKVGNLVMYNPWSIISCINKSGRFDVYWVNTGNNDLIKQLILSSWSLLLFAGYLKAIDSVFNTRNGLYDCTLVIPNQEVATLYNRFFEEWLLNRFPSQSRYDTFLNHLLEGKVNEFTRDLSAYLLQSASFFDTTSTKQGESFYHGFVLAMLASISDRYYIRSNRESGLGRYDLLLIPKKEGSKALLLEFKQVWKEEELGNASRLALDQIQIQAYHTEILQYPHVKEVVECGIAFSGKSVIATYANYDLVGKKIGDVILTDRYVQE